VQGIAFAATAAFRAVDDHGWWDDARDTGVRRGRGRRGREQLLVDVLGVGVSVGVTKPTENVLSAGKLNGGRADVEEEVGMEQVMKTLERLMDDGDEGEQRRRKAQELKAKANGALEKGGSSYMNLEKLIQSSVS